MTNVIQMPERVESEEPFSEAHGPGDRLTLIAGGRVIGSITRGEATQIADVFRAFDLPVLADWFDRVAAS